MLNQVFSFLVLMACGVLLAFVVGSWLHLSMKKANKQSREDALKVQTSEPADLE